MSIQLDHLECVEGRFCLTWSYSHLVPKKQTEAYINYEFFVLLAQAYY